MLFKQLIDKILSNKSQGDAQYILDLEAQIKHLIYEIYGLSFEEVNLVESI